MSLLMPLTAALLAATSAVQVMPVLQLRPRADTRVEQSAKPADNMLIATGRFGGAGRIGELSARAVGQISGKLGKSPNMQVYEAYLQYGSSDALSLRAGRQVIVWHEMRLFGHKLWRPQGLAHDSVRLQIQSARWHLDAMAGRPFDSERPFAAARLGYHDKAANGSDHVLADAVYVGDGSKWNVKLRHTFGGYVRL